MPTIHVELFEGRTLEQKREYAKALTEVLAGAKNAYRDIVLINGIEDIGIGVTVTDPANPQPLPMLSVSSRP